MYKRYIAWKLLTRADFHLRYVLKINYSAPLSDAQLRLWGTLWLCACARTGMVLLELITRKKIGEDGFARRTPAKLFALEAEEVKQESPPDAPSSLLQLTAMCVKVVVEFWDVDDLASALAVIFHKVLRSNEELFHEQILAPDFPFGRSSLRQRWCQGQAQIPHYYYSSWAQACVTYIHVQSTIRQVHGVHCGRETLCRWCTSMVGGKPICGVVSAKIRLWSK